MLKEYFTGFFRSIGLMHFIDQIKFFMQKIQFRNENRKFVEEHPNVELPEDYVLFESFKLHYRPYFYGGLKTAKWLTSQLSQHYQLKDIKLLDWGCGPGRLIRHLPNIMDDSVQIVGSDYSHRTIEWCSKNISGVEFIMNDLAPPLRLSNDEIDIVYAISVFTHLSYENIVIWLEEIKRVLKPNGIFLFSTHGNVFVDRLTRNEQMSFVRGQFVSRKKVKEGHRTYATFHPPKAMQSLLQNLEFEILSHEEGTKKNWGAEQDIWICKNLEPFQRERIITN